MRAVNFEMSANAKLTFQMQLIFLCYEYQIWETLSSSNLSVYPSNKTFYFNLERIDHAEIQKLH